MLNSILEAKKSVKLCLNKLEKLEIDNLLHVPIILLMVCTIFIESKELPKTKTDTVGKIFKLAMVH